MMSGGNSQEKYMGVQGEVSVSYSFHCCDLSPPPPRSNLWEEKFVLSHNLRGFTLQSRERCDVRAVLAGSFVLMGVEGCCLLMSQQRGK